MGIEGSPTRNEAKQCRTIGCTNGVSTGNRQGFCAECYRKIKETLEKRNT